MLLHVNTTTTRANIHVVWYRSQPWQFICQSWYWHQLCVCPGPTSAKLSGFHITTARPSTRPRLCDEIQWQVLYDIVTLKLLVCRQMTARNLPPGRESPNERFLLRKTHNPKRMRKQISRCGFLHCLWCWAKNCSLYHNANLAPVSLFINTPHLSWDL